jgi:hypothetical protein
MQVLPRGRNGVNAGKPANYFEGCKAGLSGSGSSLEQRRDFRMVALVGE